MVSLVVLCAFDYAAWTLQVPDFDPQHFDKDVDTFHSHLASITWKVYYRVVEPSDIVHLCVHIYVPFGSVALSPYTSLMLAWILYYQHLYSFCFSMWSLFYSFKIM